MNSLSIAAIARAGSGLPTPSGIPDIFAEHINQRWSLASRGDIVLVRLRSPARTNWITLGNALLQELLPVDAYAGVCLDGQVPFDTVPTWLEAFARPEASSYVNVKLASRESLHSHAFDLNVTWISFQQATSNSWPGSFWERTDSQWFNFGADLLLTIQPNDVASTPSWDLPFDIDLFTRMIGGSDGWMIPLDENQGFYVGLPVGFDLHRAVTIVERALDEVAVPGTVPGDHRSESAHISN